VKKEKRDGNTAITEIGTQRAQRKAREDKEGKAREEKKRRDRGGGDGSGEECGSGGGERCGSGSGAEGENAEAQAAGLR